MFDIFKMFGFIKKFKLLRPFFFFVVELMARSKKYKIVNEYKRASVHGIFQIHTIYLKLRIEDKLKVGILALKMNILQIMDTQHTNNRNLITKLNVSKQK